MVQPTQTALVARKVRRIRFGLYAHRDYLKRHGTPRSMEDLLHHTLIGFDKGAIAIKVLRRRVEAGRWPQIRTDRDLASSSACQNRANSCWVA